MAIGGRRNYYRRCDVNVDDTNESHGRKQLDINPAIDSRERLYRETGSYLVHLLTSLDARMRMGTVSLITCMWKTDQVIVRKKPFNVNDADHQNHLEGPEVERE
jgi:hypothetical protein